MGKRILYSDGQIGDFNMNLSKMRKKSLFDYKAVIFDLDGTLYYQKPFRRRMLFYLLGHVLKHPSGVKDMLLIKKYREYRENWEKYEKTASFSEGADLDRRQYELVAKVKKVSPERVEKAVSFFMLEAPLKLLPAYRDEILCGLTDKLHQENVKVVVYSDYPVEDKLNALGIRADARFTSADKSIGCMKPDPRGLRVILEKLGLGAEEAIMIGDRYEKDGLAAEGNGMDYIIVSASKKERHKNHMPGLL